MAENTGKGKGKGKIHITTTERRIIMGRKARYDRIKINSNSGKNKSVNRIKIDVPERKRLPTFYYKKDDNR